MSTTDSTDAFVCPNCGARVRQFVALEVCDCGYAPRQGAD
jgi:predicted RNA-binding Zn-ribbon protein involved in translation (DUF1610 family)